MFAFASLAVPTLVKASAAEDPLPSWDSTAPKQALIAFVERVTKEGLPDFVLPRERIAIETLIGRRPIASFGNSDGDQQMLEWTTAGSGARFALIVHDEAEREWAYDRKSQVGQLEAVAKGWIVVSMKGDWKTIFPKEAESLKPTGSPTGKPPAPKSLRVVPEPKD